MPELVQEEKQEEQQNSQQQQKQVIDVQEDSQSELDVRSREVEQGLEINLEETTVTQRVEKFVEAGEEKKLVELDEDTDSRSFTLTPPGARYSGMIHPMSNVETTEHVEVDFSPAMHRWRMFSHVLNPEAEVKQVTFPQVPEIETEEQVSTGPEPELEEVEQILDSDIELPSPEESLEEGYSEEEEYEYEEQDYDEEEETGLEVTSILETAAIDEALDEEDDYVNLIVDIPASIEVEEGAEAERFDVSGYDLSTLIAEQEESPASELLEYLDSDGLEEFSLLSDNLMLAEYLPEQTEEGIHQRLVYRVEEEVAGSTVKGVAEYLSETAPVQVSVEEKQFYSPEEFEMNGELKESGKYTVHGFDIDGMDDSMTEFRVNNELAEDSIEHVEVETGDYVDFVEAEVYSGHD